MSDSRAPHFSVFEALPGPGITVLEASAGTGKTYTIAALAVRYIAEGLPISQLLAVTFTRTATSELRSRIRARLAQAYQQLRAGQPAPGDEEFFRSLTDAPAAQVAARVRRLRAALANFDSATVTTTHGFCEAALAELGLAGDSQMDPIFVPDINELAHEVAIDTYVNQFAHRADLTWRPQEALKLAGFVRDNPSAPIRPEPADAGDLDRARIEYAQSVRREIARRKRHANVMTYDDQVERLREAVTDGTRGSQAVELLQQRYRVILVDEFQDTDTAQWQALHRAFGTGTSTLILIGDPKQAIYAFRGADINAYLAARREGQVSTLATNYRSSARLVNAMNEFFADVRFGAAEIGYLPAKSGRSDERSDVCPMTIRLVSADANTPTNRDQTIKKDYAVGLIANDVAAAIVARLGDTEADRQVAPGDIAVLVNEHREAARIARALQARSVPVVIRGNRSVFETDAAKSLLRLLAALDSPGSDTAVRRLAATELIGMRASEMASDDSSPETPLNQLRRDLLEWQELFELRGLEAVFDAVRSNWRVDVRLLARIDGERAFTDLLQAVELLGARARGYQLGLPALAMWLGEEIANAAQASQDERMRRLDTDADAVQVVTIHASKGLEYSVVYCPFLWVAPRVDSDGEAYVYHDGEQRVLYVGRTATEERRRVKEDVLAANEAEAMRKAYVGITRAKDELTLHWCRGLGFRRSPLYRILAQHDANPDVAAEVLASSCPDVAAVPVRTPSSQSWAVASDEVSLDLHASTFDRELDSRWRRTSFSSMTAAAHDAKYGVAGGEPTAQGIKDDEADVDGAVDGDAQARIVLSAQVSPLSDVPGGTEFGTFVHSVLEHIDFAADDLATQIRTYIGANRRWLRLGEEHVERLVAGIVSACHTELGADVDNLRLADISRRDRLDEMAFELPLAGGDDPCGYVSPGAIATRLERLLPANDPLRAYLPRLREPTLAADVRGYLTGAIDLVFRFDSASGQRYSIVDYKTNRLAVGPLRAWEYRPDAVTTAVFDSHYPLQFLIYQVALHRYLRQRIPTYSPDRHLGPVKYLFVRGMFGAENPVVDGQPCGVFSWQPTTAVVEGLSELFAHGESR